MSSALQRDDVEQQALQTNKTSSLVFKGDESNPPKAACTQEHLRLEVVRRETVVQSLANESLIERPRRPARERASETREGRGESYIGPRTQAPHTQSGTGGMG